MVDIALGHQMDCLMHLLGPFVSVTATAHTYYNVATIVDNDNKPTGKTLENEAPDHVTFTGLLKSGAIANVIMRAGHPSTPGRRQLLWEIDGELGTIRMEGDARRFHSSTEPELIVIHVFNIAGSAFTNIRNPKLYLNGELVDVQPGGMMHNLTSAWAEFAKGKDGNYATLEDAVRVRTLLEGVLRSAREKCMIEL